ncbi:DNA ligase D [Solitalea sp. MAHUQ-68]|uniref:DNA ligase (ATP) n=1 Tax=Solitalea agri TaxID=2953739 RepID=A0A9X2JDM8_9SPHI|nr:DNA ligase D [Solitalea agri]MCO4294637.1 DNA ligase D [Solitalea agri]
MGKLEKYYQKRDFSHTSEPKGGKETGKKLTFVVQRHHASRLHYDFRLELDGVLKSWAIPKGPSLNPLDKRLAIMVEDHPLDYQRFEGEIPKGNYGAGNVLIWDKGYYEPLLPSADVQKEIKRELHNGDLKIVLKGSKLKGEFALVKFQNAEENAWLLIKHKDKFAVNKAYNSEDEVPASIKKKKNVTSSSSTTKPKTKETHKIGFQKPMLATSADAINEKDEWIYEPKLDGYRIISVIKNGETELFSRNAQNYTVKYGQIADVLREVGHTAILDGEIVKLNAKGVVDFNALQNFNKKPTGKIYYYVFDLIYLNGHFLTELSLLQRKELLKTFIDQLNNPQIVFTPFAKSLKELEKEMHISTEGYLAKQINSKYYLGKRSSEWLKIKNENDDEFLIAGYTEPQNKNDFIGALLLVEKKGNEITFRGKCGTGWNNEMAQEMRSLLQPLEVSIKPFKESFSNRTKIHYVNPQIMCTVKFTELTPEGRLRHPVLKDIRYDKMETKTHAQDKTQKIGSVTLKFTNLGKVYFPELNLSKGDVINYYDQVSDHILPHLKNRALSLNRHPNGIHGESFYQKDTPESSPAWLKTTPIYSESNDKQIDYLVCNNKASLLYMANLGCIEINPWLSKISKPDNPDYLVIDLDPENIDFKYVIDTALATNELCIQLGLKSFVKTSGSTGLHIFLHLGAKYSFDSSRIFAEWLANSIHQRIPSFTSIERSPQKRQKKVYIDFLQNRKGQTIAAPFSLRPKPEATVSWPLKWKQVNHKLKMNDYTIFNVPDLLKNYTDPWSELAKTSVNLKSIGAKLE